MKRRSKGEIDRRYLLGDALMKASGALTLAAALAAIATPFTLDDASASLTWSYAGVLLIAVLVALLCAMLGRRIRRTAAALERG